MSHTNTPPAELPVPNTARWTVRRKAAVVQAVRNGSLTLDEYASGMTYAWRSSALGSVIWIDTALPAYASRAFRLTGPMSRLQSLQRGLQLESMGERWAAPRINHSSIARDPEILAEERLWERWSTVRRGGQDNEPQRRFLLGRSAPRRLEWLGQIGERNPKPA
jgi:hypothetical protein